jgi:transcription antitermination factor NusG
MTMIDVRMDLAKLAAIDATRRAHEATSRRGHSQNPRWHVAHISPGRSDKHALEWLGRGGFESYYPQERKSRPIPRKRQSQKQRRAMFPPSEMIDVPLFPRYVFVRFDPTGAAWHEEFEIAGVGGMLCYGGVPAPIAEAEIERIRGGEIEGAIPAATPVRFLLAPGEQVRILEGSFAHLHATVDKGIDCAIADLPADARIRVLATLFGRVTPIELELAQVERIEQPPE